MEYQFVPMNAEYASEIYKTSCLKTAQSSAARMKGGARSAN
jgi:hypothetical protein